MDAREPKKSYGGENDTITAEVIQEQPKGDEMSGTDIGWAILDDMEIEDIFGSFIRPEEDFLDVGSWSGIPF